MSREHQKPIVEVKEETETAVIENNVVRWIVIKAKKHWMIALLLGPVWYSPIHDAISSQYPMRNESVVNDFREKTTLDNHNLLAQVAAGFTVESNETFSMEAKVDRLQSNMDAIKQQVNDIKESVHNIDSRVDLLFVNQSKGK